MQNGVAMKADQVDLPPLQAMLLEEYVHSGSVMRGQIALRVGQGSGPAFAVREAARGRDGPPQENP